MRKKRIIEREEKEEELNNTTPKKRRKKVIEIRETWKMNAINFRDQVINTYHLSKLKAKFIFY